MRPWGLAILPVLAVAALIGWRWSAPSVADRPTPGIQSRPRAEVQVHAEAAGESRQPADAALPVGVGFDFYVLALSWSPGYYAAEGKDANRQQCARSHAFVVHGLWPQFEHGYPQGCPTDEPKVTNATLRGLYDIMPSAGLIRHEWRAHGACAGLVQRDYFRVLRAARGKVVIPPQFRRPESFRQLAPGEVEAAFLRANPALPAEAVAVTCGRRYLREVRICMTRNLAFRPCPELDRKACRRRRVTMPPVRGG